MWFISSSFYAAAFVLVMFLWPLGLHRTLDSQTQLIFWSIMTANTLLAILVWYYNSSEDLSYFAGLEDIGESFMSGCANITLLYLPFILVFAYFMAIYYTLLGFSKGREYTQEQWRRMVIRCRKYRLRQS